MWKILIIDDNPDDRAACRRRLQRDPDTQYLLEEAQDGGAGLAACQTFQPDCVLLDYRLPDLDGLQVLTHLTEKMGSQTPAVVMMAGTDQEAVAVEAMKRGAQDYLRKEMLTTEELRHAIANAVEKVALRREIDAHRQRTNENEARLRLALEAARMGAWEWDIQANTITWSENLGPMFGLAPGASPGSYEHFLATVHPDDRDRLVQAVHRALEGEAAYEIEFRSLRPDGSVRWTFTKGQVNRDAAGRALRMIGIDMDITARKQAEGAFAKEIRERQQLEERYRLVTTAANDAVYQVDTEGRIAFTTPALAQLTGYPMEELQGRPSLDLYIPEAAPTFLERRRRALNGEPVSPYLETELLRRDGSRVPVEMAVTNFLLNGQIAGRVSVTRDITARKQVEAALRESEIKFAMAFQLNPLPMALLTSEGRYVEMNDALERSLGYTRAEMYGRTTAELGFHVEPQRREMFYQLLRAEGRVRDFEAVWQSKTGERRIFLISAEPLILKGEQYVIAINNDITARKQAEDERERLTAELQQFAYIVSHDLKEPLRTVSNFLSLLERRYQSTLDAEGHEYITFAMDGAQRMQQMIQDLLAYTRAGQGPEMEAVDCEAVFTRVVDALALQINECGAVITHEPLPTVLGDATRLGQVFQNLIGNALKFRGPTAPRIHVSARREGQGWRFAVRDNGIGLDPTQAERIFQVFQRLHTRREYAGTGIGLSICKKIVEQHGGRIWVESRPGEGAIFYFTISEKK